MKIIKRLFFIFALAFTAILLTGCSVKAEDLNEVAKEASEAMDKTNGAKITMNVSAKGEDEGKKVNLKVKVKLSINNDEEIEYSVKVSGKQDDKKMNVKESGVVIKDGDSAYKVYVDHKSNVDGTKSEFKNVYSATSSSVFEYVNEYVLMAEFYYALIGGMGLYKCETITQEELDNGEENVEYKASSFLGTYKFVSVEKDGDETETTTLKFNKKGITSISSITDAKDGKMKANLSVKYKDVKIKAPKGNYTEVTDN